MEQNIDIENQNVLIYIDNEKKLQFELSGLIANNLLQKYKRPTILLRPFIDEKGTDEYRGSVRAPMIDGIDSFQQFLKDTMGVNDSQGHSNGAMGIMIERELFPQFKAHLNERLNNYDLNTSTYEVDLISKWNEVNKPIATIFAKDEIWCNGVSAPLAVIKDISTTRKIVMGSERKHCKFHCGDYDIVIFNCPELIEKMDKEDGTLTVVGTFGWNTYNGEKTLQLIAENYEFTEEKC